MAAKKNTSIALGEKHLAYAHRKVASGEFGSVSEVVRDALRRSEERDLRMEALDRELQEGLESGIATDFDWDEFMKRKFGPDGDDS